MEKSAHFFLASGKEFRGRGIILPNRSRFRLLGVFESRGGGGGEGNTGHYSLNGNAKYYMEEGVGDHGKHGHCPRLGPFITCLQGKLNETRELKV